MDIGGNIRVFLEGDGHDRGRGPDERNASFDYCFNHFQSFREAGCIGALAAPEHLATSCLHLGFYLASWGMLRGSSFLLQRSSRFYVPLMEAIAATGPDVWAIDANCYHDDNIATLLALKTRIVQALGPGNAPSDTLVSKIMLGVFGNVPAFDSNFVVGFRTAGYHVSELGERALAEVGRFYAENSAAIEAHRVATLDFATGGETARRYTRAKVIDMACFVEGLRVQGSAPAQ